MATRTDRHFDLTVLTVALQADDDPPSVVCTLSTAGDPVRRWVLSTAELGLPAALDCSGGERREHAFRLPDALLRDLGGAVPTDRPPVRPLWLELVRPYGHLGVVPWEQLLVPHLPVPLVRLPEFAVEPVRSRRSITVVLCADDGPGDPAPQAAAVTRLAAKISHSIPLPATVHIFATAALHERLRDVRSPVEWADRVLLHDPAGGSDADSWRLLESTGSTDSAAARRPHAWLDWVRRAMCGESTDIVHFLAPAVLRLDQGALALSASPADPDAGRAPVSTAALTRFTLELGAWGCAFSSPDDACSDIGLRQLVTALAGLRPATLLHHEPRLDPELSALGAAYRLITGPEPGPVPRDPAVLLCCQPSEVGTEPHGRAPLPDPPGQPTDRVRSMLADVTTPAWVSAGQRYVEQYEWRLNQWRGPDQLPAPDALADGVTHALRLIQDVLDRYADAPTTPLPPVPAADISATPAVPREQP